MQFIMFQPKNFYAVLKPMYYCTFLIGMTPFSVHTEVFKKSKVYLLWSLLVMIFLNSYTTFSLTKRNRRTMEVISRVTDGLDVILGQLATCFGILFGCTSVNKILGILENINDFDTIVQADFKIDLKKEYRKGCRNIVIALGLVTTYIIIMCTVTSMATAHVLDYVGLYLAYICPPIINSFVDFQFCTLILCTKRRFRWLNTTVLASSPQDRHIFLDKNIVKVQPAMQVMQGRLINDKILDIIEKVRIRHHDLCTICKKINEAFSLRILLLVVQSFISVTVLLYYAGDRILLEENMTPLYLAYCGTQITLSTLQLLLLVISCSTTSIEARKTAVLIHKVMATKETNHKDDMQLEVTLFSLQLLHHNVEITACRMFVINESLLFSIIGAVTTYLIIVIQFELGSVKQSQN